MRSLAEKAGLSQAEIARRLRLSPPVVGNWFQGRNLPETTVLPELATVLGTSIDNLFSNYSESIDSQPLDEIVREDLTADAPGPAAKELQRRVRQHVDTVLRAAGGDVQRLGWIAEQLRQHVSEPVAWGLHRRVIEEALAEEPQGHGAQPSGKPGKIG